MNLEFGSSADFASASKTQVKAEVGEFVPVPGLLEIASVSETDSRLEDNVTVDEILAAVNALGSRDVQRQVGYTLTHFGELTARQRLANALQTIRQFVEGRRPTGRREVHTVTMPMTELHAPKVKDCSATHEVKLSTGISTAVSVGVLGLGGGTGGKQTIKSGFDHKVESKCEALHVGVEYELLEYANRSGEKSWVGNARRIGHELFWYPIPAAEDFCQVPEEKVVARGWKTQKVDISKSTGKSGASYQVERGKTATLKAGAKVPVLQIEFESKIEIEWVLGALYSYSLAPGRVYLGYTQSDPLSYKWSWT